MTVSDVVALISAASALVAIFFAVKNGKRTDTKEIERRAAERTETNMKLDAISRDVKETKENSKETARNMQALADKVAVVDSKADKAHYRLDRIEDELEGLEKKVEQNERKEHKA